MYDLHFGYCAWEVWNASDSCLRVADSYPVVAATSSCVTLGMLGAPWWNQETQQHQHSDRLQSKKLHYVQIPTWMLEFFMPSELSFIASRDRASGDIELFDLLCSRKSGFLVFRVVDLLPIIVG